MLESDPMRTFWITGLRGGIAMRSIDADDGKVASHVPHLARTEHSGDSNWLVCQARRQYAVDQPTIDCVHGLPDRPRPALGGLADADKDSNPKIAVRITRQGSLGEETRLHVEMGQRFTPRVERHDSSRTALPNAQHWTPSEHRFIFAP